MKIGIIVGSILIITGAGMFAYYDKYVKYERVAQELLTEGKLVFERGDKTAINKSINLFTKIIAKYPGSEAETEAFFYIAQSYERLQLNRLAYLKYVYILKSKRNVSPYLNNEIRSRLARLKVMRRYTEEGINQLLTILNNTNNRDLRSRVYTELGHTFLKMKAYRKSKRMFDIALSESGDNEDALLGKARTYKRLGEDYKAYNLYEYYFKYYGAFSHYYNDVKRSYLEQVYQSGHREFRRGKYYSAITYFERILKYFSHNEKTENCLYWIGQCHYVMKNYQKSLRYFNRVLSNQFSHKDQNARMKKGYIYFASKKYDLAAREFQVYINSYPRGIYISMARQWKEMCTREIMYRVKSKMLPDIKEYEQTEKPESSEKSDDSDIDEKVNDEPTGVSNNNSKDIEDFDYENVAEL